MAWIRHAGESSEGRPEFQVQARKPPAKPKPIQRQSERTSAHAGAQSIPMATPCPIYNCWSNLLQATEAMALATTAAARGAGAAGGRRGGGGVGGGGAGALAAAALVGAAAEVVAIH